MFLESLTVTIPASPIATSTHMGSSVLQKLLRFQSIEPDYREVACPGD